MKQNEKQENLNYTLDWDHDLQEGESRTSAFIFEKLWWALLPLAFTGVLLPVVFFGGLSGTVPAMLILLALGLAIPAAFIEYISSTPVTPRQAFQKMKASFLSIISFGVLKPKDPSK